MVKSTSTILGIGLVILTIAGWATTGTAPWLSWLDLLGAICGFWIAGAAETRSAHILSPIFAGIGLLILWIAGLATAGVPVWQAWWTFAFGCAYVLIGIVDIFVEPTVPHATPGA